ncbi:hypothetical protein GCM10011519_16480 [Marmoricola endophyticus]|uniref:MCE family protein n=1 Tax=Marmoricola endophyticus TaxID=2040280 RepID=A0A917F4W1_9ACTN|nr:hypothetical protein GCM10011519_16480 [Marmoricola endophyticus]
MSACLGLSLVTGCSGSVYDLPLPGGPSVGDSPMTVHVRFRDVLDLVPNSLVKVNDVSVGKVTAIDLKGYTADVTLELPKGTDLPDNAQAQIRQTSLLGEKFVSLAPPASGAEGRLQGGDTIPLSRSGRNPEVEEVFSALSLLLNGGGVAQLRTIAQELNNAVGGREDEVRDTLEQLRQFTGQLDARKQQVVDAIDSLNRLAVAAKKQDSTIKLTLDELPSSIASINSQRADLVKTLRALDNLSDVGVRVIRKTKADTVATVNDLGPVLDKLADAGSALPNSIQVALSYPFVDEAVGGSPQVARNIHLGDYVNLSATLDIDAGLLGDGCKFVVGVISQALSSAGLSGNALGQAVNAVLGQLVAKNGACDQFQAGSQALLNALKPILTALAPALKIGEAGLQQVLDALGGLLGNGGAGQVITNPQTSQQSAPLSGLTQRRSNGGGVLGGLVGGGSSSGTAKKNPGSASPQTGSGSGATSSSSGGGWLSGLFGLGRAPTGYDVADAVRDGNGRKGDPLNGPAGTAAELGYNSTLGALLLQGVSTK